MLTERDWIIGIFDAIGALAERLTGERLVVQLTDSEGKKYRAYRSSSVSWITIAEAPDALQAHVPPVVSVALPKEPPMPRDTLDQGNATQIIESQSQQESANCQPQD
jgi:hypothetical protein